MAAIIMLSACTTISFDELPPGKFTGSLFVMWVGEGGSSGDGKFVFVPDPSDRLTFQRGGTGPGQTIVPGVMYTDGGSIPQVFQVFRGLHPWGYAPAYVVHDWLFTAHQCLSDGRTDKDYRALSDVDFDNSANILGEAIQALIKQRQVSRDDVAGSAITAAVASPIARNSWNKKGACADDEVTEADLREIEKAVPGSTTREARRRNLDIAAGAKNLRRASRARLVTRVSLQ
ncbi:hypothetical protein CPY51_12580 [Rhizobium tubonense]|uniref:DUF1353 domain-containing protein n=2 Tax=Rhizobium tubonense TaxID=484088 RepID=A0A2W4ETF2_9HYPH|nr:hypothetical protein CPY51_12580 [Rhizobium tubonense]